MYRIIGADQKEYGPVTQDQICQWIAEGRANAHSRARNLRTASSGGRYPVSRIRRRARRRNAAAATPPLIVNSVNPDTSAGDYPSWL
jgi:hypothetical protein